MSVQESLVTQQKLPRQGYFQTGGLPGPGRPKGSRNKLAEDFVAALHDDFQQHGVQAIIDTREKSPSKYLEIITHVLPREFTPAASAIADMTEDEIEQYLTNLRSAIVELDRARASSHSGVGEEEIKEVMREEP